VATHQHTIIFDTLAYAKKLISAGVPEKQAEVQAEALAEFVNEQMISQQYLDLRLAEVKSDIIKWVAGMLVAQAVIIATLIKLL
jgi:hypothetical protein